MKHLLKATIEHVTLDLLSAVQSPIKVNWNVKYGVQKVKPAILSSTQLTNVAPCIAIVTKLVGPIHMGQLS